MFTKEVQERICGIIGHEYINSPRFEHEEDDYIREAFRTICEVNAKLFELLPVQVVFTNEDPYDSAKQMRQVVQATGTCHIYTESSGHPILTKEENCIGRAVHDILAHCVCGCPFTFAGEYSAYLTQRLYYPEWVWGVLWAEIPAQTATFYYAKGFNFPQRAFEAPKKWQDLCIGMEQDFSKNSVLKPVQFGA